MNINSSFKPILLILMTVMIQKGLDRVGMTYTLKIINVQSFGQSTSLI